jgi:hypothetical protein
MFKMRSDTIQFLIMVIAGMCMVGGFWGYCEGHFAKADDLKYEVSERRELKGEVDQLYMRMIPANEQVPLRYRPSRENK